MWAFFSACMLAISAAIVLLIRRYAAKNVAPVVLVATAYAWLTAMMIIALVPIDVAASMFLMPTTAISIIWNIAYWSTQVATWLVLPFYQVYSDAGDFSVKNKCWTSLKENVILYGALGALGAVGVVILLFAGHLRWENMIGYGIALSNTFGLVVGILLVGYGLVEIPRDVWKTSNPEVLLKWCAHRSGKFAESVMRTTAELETVVTIIYANSRQMRRHDPLKPYMDIISDYAEHESPVRPSEMATRNVDLETLSAEDLEYNFDKKGLSGLRRRMFHAISEYKAARCQYEEVMLESFELEDIVKCRQNQEYTRPPPRVVNGVGVCSADAAALAIKADKPWNRPLWGYKCIVRPYANKAFAVVLGLTGLCILWGEAVIGVTSVDLSPFSLMVRGVAPSAFMVEVLTLLPLVYICACSYYALFRITAFDYNKLVPRATTGTGLMQNGTLMCRFAAPICWNYYHILRMYTDVGTDGEDKQTCSNCIETVFSRNMSSMSAVFGNINMYLPITLVVWCLLVASTLLDRILNACVPAKFKFSSDDVEDEYTEKGRLLIRKEQEAMLKGYRIGEVLHSAYFDLEFPTIARAGKKPPKSGFSFFGKKKTLEPLEPPKPISAVMPQGRSYTSAAAQAASRWVKPNGSESSAIESLAAADTQRTSLLSSRYEQSVTEGPPPATSTLFGGMGTSPSKAAGGSGGTAAGRGGASKPGGSGLDGIFAEIGRLGGPARGSDAQPAYRETDSLLGATGKFGRS